MIITVTGQSGFTEKKEYEAIQVIDYVGTTREIDSVSYVATNESGVSVRIPSSSVTKVSKVNPNENADYSAAAESKRTLILQQTGKKLSKYADPFGPDEPFRSIGK